MLIPFLISKIHRAVVTHTDLHYEGSIAIDMDIADKAGLRHFQKVDIYNISNGNRFSTYVLPGERGSGMFMINGAAARLASPGDLVIIAAYGLVNDAEIDSLKTVIVTMNEKNEIIKTTHE